MPNVATNDLAHMRTAVFFDEPGRRDKLSRFWMLLVLAAIIASAGVVADSTATVIGAMIVAPLMTPILGTMLGVVLADRRNVARSVVLVLAGAAVAVLIGYLVGLTVVRDVVADNNSQVAGRVNPRLIDMLAALATGVVGSIALVRKDISDTLPGVAIAISLVPPLSVVGLTLEAGAYEQSLGALLLFATNVAAILAAGMMVMAFFGVHRMADEALPAAGTPVLRRGRASAVVVVLVMVIIGLLAKSTISIARDTNREVRARRAADRWGDEYDWSVRNISTRQDKVVIVMGGPLPIPDTKPLRDEMSAEGVDPGEVEVDLVPSVIVDLGD
jgi:uncharacterized hydrophobic protein (TIGR00271 family)